LHTGLSLSGFSRSYSETGLIYYPHPMSQSKKELTDKGIYAQVDNSGDRLAKMIRNGEQQRIPLLAVVGAKEVESGTLSVRGRKIGDFGALSVPEVVAGIKKAVAEAGVFTPPS